MCRSSTPLDQVAVCFSGIEAQTIWHDLPEDLVEFTDVDRFFRLVKDLSDKERDAIHKAGCERANELLLKNGTVVVIVAHWLLQQGYMTPTEFKHLIPPITDVGREALAETKR